MKQKKMCTFEVSRTMLALIIVLIIGLVAAGGVVGYIAGTEVGTSESYSETVEDDNSATVYVTKSGKKFHKKSCKTIKGKDITETTVNKAQNSGYDRCSVCKP